MWMFYSVNNLSFGLFYDIWWYHLRLSADQSIFLNKNISSIQIWNSLCNLQDDNGHGNILTLVIVQVFQSNFPITILPIFEPWLEMQKVDAAIDDMQRWSIHLAARDQVFSLVHFWAALKLVLHSTVYLDAVYRKRLFLKKQRVFCAVVWCTVCFKWYHMCCIF